MLGEFNEVILTPYTVIKMRNRSYDNFDDNVCKITGTLASLGCPASLSKPGRRCRDTYHSPPCISPASTGVTCSWVGHFYSRECSSLQVGTRLTSALDHGAPVHYGSLDGKGLQVLSLKTRTSWSSNTKWSVMRSCAYR